MRVLDMALQTYVSRFPALIPRPTPHEKPDFCTQPHVQLRCGQSSYVISKPRNPKPESLNPKPAASRGKQHLNARNNDLRQLRRTKSWTKSY